VILMVAAIAVLVLRFRRNRRERGSVNGPQEP
jgi:hypothetical protein